jgi:hypothetical protein
MPALNPRPSARKTTACTSGRSSTERSARATPNQPSIGSALTGG